MSMEQKMMARPAAGWVELTARVQELDERFRSRGSSPWFRGHRQASWKLNSTIHRYLETFTERLKEPFTANDRMDLLREEYKSMYRSFKVEAWPLLSTHERSDWGILFAMQHFGIPTNLLDWTESFACALFFAQLHRKPEETASIWVLNPAALNNISIQQNGIVAIDEDLSTPSTFDVAKYHPKLLPPSEALPTIAAAPIYTNPRMVSQRSVFTVMGDSFEPLDKQLDGLVQSGDLVELQLPPETFRDAEGYLNVAGVTAYTYFPDLQGLALKHTISVQQKLRDLTRFYPNAVS